MKLVTRILYLVSLAVFAVAGVVLAWNTAVVILME
jgi:hypothetical protein